MSRVSLSCAVLAILTATAAHSQQERPHFVGRGNMRLTDSESLWTGRFSDCELRYYVLIPNGFVAHGNRPPGRLHGVLFGLPDTGTTDVVTLDDDRFISIMARSNEFEVKSLTDFADHVLNDLAKAKSGFEVKAHESSRLDGEPAIRLKVEYDDPDGRTVEEKLLSLRLGVLYAIGMRTTAEHYDIDAQNFAKVVAGFRFWTNYRCVGTSNNP